MIKLPKNTSKRLNIIIVGCGQVGATLVAEYPAM